MTGAAEIGEIIATYTKHGWILRRVLLSAQLAQKLGDAQDNLFNDIPVTISEIAAAWFSRPPKPGGVAWELRYLGTIPFALLENIDENATNFETALKAVESRLRDSIHTKLS